MCFSVGLHSDLLVLSYFSTLHDLVKKLFDS